MPGYQLSQKIFGIQASGGNSGGNSVCGGPLKGGQTATASTIHRGRYTQAVTILGNAWAKNIIRPSLPHARKMLASLFRPQAIKMYQTPSVSSMNYSQPLLKWRPTLPNLVEILRGIILMNTTVAKRLPYQGTQASPSEEVPPSAPRLDLQSP